MTDKTFVVYFQTLAGITADQFAANPSNPLIFQSASVTTFLDGAPAEFPLTVKIVSVANHQYYDNTVVILFTTAFALDPSPYLSGTDGYYDLKYRYEDSVNNDKLRTYLVSEATSMNNFALWNVTSPLQVTFDSLVEIEDNHTPPSEAPSMHPTKAPTYIHYVDSFNGTQVSCQKLFMLFLNMTVILQLRSFLASRSPISTATPVRTI